MAKSESTISVEQHSAAGLLWCVGWLFSIGFLKLSFWRGVLALLIWPYFLGAHFTPNDQSASSEAVVERTVD